VWVDLALKARRRLLELEEREQLQAELVANVSHEFRTPLNIIGGYTELLAMGEFGELREDAAEILGRVHEACRNLSELVGDFLRYARVEARVEEVGESEIVTADLVAELERYGHVLLGDRKPVVFETETALAPRSLISDGVKLRTILRNLLTNAAKFTDSGRIAMRIEEDEAGLAIEVEDTGLGIPPEAQSLIFEPFRQLDGSITRSHGGVGLGLALSRKLARLLGGDLTVRSAMGEGSTFTLRLPATAVAKAANGSATLGATRVA
jgi:signal transduction histidine kinase